ncbi:Hint domain-containing protein [Archangium lipolyticum]|uniref:Hint domain-containing protein n=1 Tax=Archangium lipolyticum TaxID=2970465 RepID=UPI0021499A39|nr:Hint domain-containing protein [Archangium lipolyticum]
MRRPTKTCPWLPSSLISVLLLVPLGACTQQRQPPPAEQVDRQALANDSLAMARLYEEWQHSLQSQSVKRGANEQMPLDLVDEAQYRFVKNRLKASGLNPLNAPRLFSRLEELHSVVRLPARPSVAPVRAAAATGAGEAWCGHMIPLGGAGGDETRVHFQGTALASCFNGSDYGYVDATAYATDKARTTFELLATESHEEYAGKVLETAPVSVTLPRQSGRELVVDSLALAFNEETGQDHFTYTSVSASLHGNTPMEGDLVVEHPRELLEGHPWDKSIRLCLERGAISGSLDCDYGSIYIRPDGEWQPFPGSGAVGIAAVDVAATRASTRPDGSTTWTPDKSAFWEPAVKPFDPARFQVPMRGKFVPHVLPECQVEKVTSKVVAVLTESGGWCEAGSSSGTLVGKGELPWKPSTSPGNYPFDGILDFGKGNCLENAQGVRLEMWVYAEGHCPDPYGGEPEYFRCPSKKEVKPVDYTRVCMAEGTQVSKPDGTRVPVERVKVGDKLLANGDGLALTVTTVHRGGESKPLVKLRDEAGREVRVTETHPMMTVARGLVQARELSVGEAVLTRTGASRLVAVERVPYDGRVYNFALGTPEELARAGSGANMLYANGFLVGDSESQQALEKQKRVDARAVLARLNGAWHQDYQLSQARGHARR